MAIEGRALDMERHASDIDDPAPGTNERALLNAGPTSGSEERAARIEWDISALERGTSEVRTCALVLRGPEVLCVARDLPFSRGIYRTAYRALIEAMRGSAA